MSLNPESVDRNGPSEDRRALTEATTWVVKVGSRSLTDDRGRLDLDQVGNLANQLVALQGLGKRVVLVSSGAVASGMGKLGLKARPSDLATLQAVAAIGQALDPGLRKDLCDSFEACCADFAHGRRAR